MATSYKAARQATIGVCVSTFVRVTALDVFKEGLGTSRVHFQPWVLQLKPPVFTVSRAVYSVYDVYNNVCGDRAVCFNLTSGHFQPCLW